MDFGPRVACRRYRQGRRRWRKRGSDPGRQLLRPLIEAGFGCAQLRLTGRGLSIGAETENQGGNSYPAEMESAKAYTSI